MAEVELELLVRPLDEERRVRVHDRPVALERETGRDADHQLLADAHVEVTRMLADRARPRSAREHDGDPLVLVERLAGERRRTRSRIVVISLHLRDDAARPRSLRDPA